MVKDAIENFPSYDAVKIYIGAILLFMVMLHWFYFFKSLFVIVPTEP